MRTKILIIMILSAILLTGCSDVPSEVKEEIDNYEKAETVQDTEICTVPLITAIEQAKDFQMNNSTNIFIENLILPDSTKMPAYDVKFYNEGMGDLFSDLQNEPLLGNDGQGRIVDTPSDLDVWKNKPDYCFTAFPELDGANYYRSESDVMISDWGVYYGQNMRMTESGCMTLYADEQNTGIGSAFQYSVEKRYVSDFSKEAETYSLCDGTSMSVAEAANFAEKFCNNNLSDSENNCFQYQVNYIDVRNVESGRYGYYISLCRKDSYGNFFDATPTYYFAYEEFEERNALIASPIYLWITTSNNIAEFEKNYTLIIDEVGASESIVGLETAVNKLSSVLAQGKSYNFDTAELKYIFEVTQSDYIDAARAFEQSESFNEDMRNAIIYSPDSIYAYGNYQITAIPYWVFTDITAKNTDTNCGAIYMINALDGSLRIENIDEYGNRQIQY